jgi:hypothetical protein
LLKVQEGVFTHGNKMLWEDWQAGEVNLGVKFRKGMLGFWNG